MANLSMRHVMLFVVLAVIGLTCTEVKGCEHNCTHHHHHHHHKTTTESSKVGPSSGEDNHDSSQNQPGGDSDHGSGEGNQDKPEAKPSGDSEEPTGLLGGLFARLWQAIQKFLAWLF